MFLVFFLNLGSYIIIGTVTLVLARTKVNEHVRQIKEEFADFARWSWRPEDNSEFAGAVLLVGPGFCRLPGETLAHSPRLSRLPKSHLSTGDPPNLLPLGVRVAFILIWVWKCSPHSAKTSALLDPELFISVFSCSSLQFAKPFLFP